MKIFAETRKRGMDTKLVLLGDGELREKTGQLAEELGIKDQVLFAGVVANVPDYLSAMDIFLLPSLYEGLPVVCVEAQAAGLPVPDIRSGDERNCTDRSGLFSGKRGSG